MSRRRKWYVEGFVQTVLGKVRALVLSAWPEGAQCGQIAEKIDVFRYSLCPVMRTVLRFGNVRPRDNATDERRMRHNRCFAQLLPEMLIAFVRDCGRVW
jgi:hypothetical protein